MSATRVVRSEVRRALARAGVREADLVAVGCSHGPDSLALADAMIAHRPGKVAIIHVNHGLRPEAEAEAERTRAFAAAAGVPVAVVAVTVTPDGGGLEAAARAARHAALLRTADELGARWVALAHTASDQTETVLHRLLRGGGSAGLAGIPPVRDRIVRPLLSVGRPTIERYLEERGLVASHDSMNDDRRFLRVRLRTDLLPALRRENPSLDASIGRLARALREVDEALVWMAERAEAELALDPKGGLVRLDAAALARWPAAVAKKLLARLAARLGSSLEAAHLDALAALAARPSRGTVSLDLPALRVRREYGDLVLEQPGSERPVGALRVIEQEEGRGPYLVRCWEPGDRMRPTSLGGRSRKLQDLFTDRKVPSPARRAARVVVRARDGEIVWAEHVGVSFQAGIQVALTSEDPPVIYD